MRDPYCQHPECHSRFTAQYARAFTSGMTTCPQSNDVVIGVIGESRHVPFHRRWCTAHALIFEGVAFG